MSKACSHTLPTNRYDHPPCHEQVGQILTETLSELVPDGEWIGDCCMMPGKGKQVSEGAPCHQLLCIPEHGNPLTIILKQPQGNAGTLKGLTLYTIYCSQVFKAPGTRYNSEK